jgi:hypothetical protein
MPIFVAACPARDVAPLAVASRAAFLHTSRHDGELTVE